MAMSFNANNGATYTLSVTCEVKIDWDENYSNNIPTFLGDKYLLVTVDTPQTGFINTTRIDLTNPLPSDNCIKLYMGHASLFVRLCRGGSIISIQTFSDTSCSTISSEISVSKGEIKPLPSITDATIQLDWNDNYYDNIPGCR